MKDLNPPVPDSPEGAKEKKQNPEKMDKDDKIRKNLVKHFCLLVSPSGMVEAPRLEAKRK
jgi:hypothetical protein